MAAEDERDLVRMFARCLIFFRRPCTKGATDKAATCAREYSRQLICIPGSLMPCSSSIVALF